MGGEEEGEGERGRRKRWMDAEEIDEGRKKSYMRSHQKKKKKISLRYGLER